MPSAITIGSPEAQRQAPERQWVRNVGWTTVDVWLGSQQAIYGLVPALQSQYDNLDITTPDGVQYKVRASIGTANDGAEEQPVNTWELLGAGQQEPLAKHSKFASLTAAEILFLEEFISTGTIDDQAAAFMGANATTFYRMLKRGQSNYQDSQWVLRHTVTVSSRAAITVSMSGINRLWFTEELPEGITPGVETAINAIPQPDSIPQDHEYAWLKQTPTITQSINSKTQIVEEWWLYFWPELLYPLAFP